MILSDFNRDIGNLPALSRWKNTPLESTTQIHVSIPRERAPVVPGLCESGEGCGTLVSCSDITNTLVGISGETDPGGRNLLFYWVHSGAIWQAVVLNSQLVYHTTLLPHQGAVASAIFIRERPRVIQVVVAYFNRGPMPHHVFNCLVWRLAHTI